MRFFRYWLPAIVWLVVILRASSPAFSAEHTRDPLFWILQLFFGPLTEHTFGAIHVFVRKLVHSLEYAILSAFWFRAWRGAATVPWHVRWTLSALGVALLTSIVDEGHQIFVPSRVGSLQDVVVDMMGATFAQLVIWIVLR